MEELLILLKYYDQEVRVLLPTSYNEFIGALCSMLAIKQERIKDFNISYFNNFDKKKYIISNEDDYLKLLNIVRQKIVITIDIELNCDNQNHNNNNKNNNNMNNIINMKKEEENKEDDLLINPYNESFNRENKSLDKNVKIRGNSNDIDNDIESIEFSFLDEKNMSKEKNIKDNIILNKYKMGDNINNNIINNNDIINSYHHGQNQLVNMNMQCNYCKNIQTEGEIYYCKDCSSFFCTNCEKRIGISHSHCYYKIRNKEQFKEICNIHNANNINKNINNNDNNNTSIQNPITGILSEGSKIIGEKINSVINFLGINNQNDNNLINPYAINNQKNNYLNNNNNINNINNNYQYLRANNNINNENNNDINNLVKKAKSQYNLSQMNDDEIERALIICKGNIDKAVALLLSNQTI